MARQTKQQKIAAARAEYLPAKRAYKNAGKKAFGKRKTSKEYKEYKRIKAHYKAKGRALGKLTGVA